jgi:hypothetical protein
MPPVSRKPFRFRLALFLSLPVLLYTLWTPGAASAPGGFAHARNGLWLAHGWMGDDSWFTRHRRPRDDYDTETARARLRQTCADNQIAYVFPHLCPATPRGELPAHDSARIEALIATLPDTKILPWVGGVYGEHCPIASPAWRTRFVEACADLIARHPRLAGLHLNIEPLPDGDPDYLLLLEELKHAIGPEKILSIAAYPPPTRWHPHPEVHWSVAYYREVDRRCDQLVPMMYDTSLRFEKIYTWLISRWTTELADWTRHSELLLGLPAYEDDAVEYHKPRVENLRNALRGVNASLTDLGPHRQRIAGLAIYADWTTTESEWADFRAHLAAPSPQLGGNASVTEE